MGTHFFAMPRYLFALGDLAPPAQEPEELPSDAAALAFADQIWKEIAPEQQADWAPRVHPIREDGTRVEP